MKVDPFVDVAPDGPKNTVPKPKCNKSLPASLTQDALLRNKTNNLNKLV